MEPVTSKGWMGCGLRVDGLQVAGCLLLCLMLLVTAAQARTLLPATPRALALGESFVALAEDGQSVVWNPAGVALVRRYTVESAYANLFGWMRTSRLSAIFPATPRFALGFDWHRDSFGDEEVNFGRDLFRLAYGIAPSDTLSLGMSLKYLSLQLDADGVSVGNATGWGTDWGILWQPTRRWNIGLAAYDALGVGRGELRTGTYVRFDTTGTEERLFSSQYALGVAYRWRDRWMLTSQLDNRWHLGIEYQPWEGMRMQAGLHDAWDRHRPTFALGMQFETRWFSLSYAYVDAPHLQASSLFSLSARLDFQAPSVEIERVRIRPIYPVLIYAYARVNHDAPDLLLDTYTPAIYSDAQVEEFYPLHPQDRVGRIWLRNLTNRPVRFKVVVSLDSYTGRRGSEAITIAELGPRQRGSFPLRQLVLSPRILQLRSSQTLEAHVEVRDLSDETRRKTWQASVVQVHGRNQIRLDDISQLAAFVSPSNAQVQRFVKLVLESHVEQIEASPLRRNYLVARILLDALRGISYASDPNIPRGRGFVDEVRFPQELLRDLGNAENRGRTLGDCDDSTVLVCTLLEAAGISTAFIQLPGHVLMAFDAGGIPLEQAQSEGFSQITAAIDGYAWIPLETTLIKQGFSAAWREGLRQLQRGVHDSITLREAWKSYPPVDLSLEPFPLNYKHTNPAEDPWDRYFVGD